MATSGSFVTTGYYDDGYPYYYSFNWSVVSQSIENNTTTIKWSLVGAGGANDYRYTVVAKRSVTVNGSAQENTTSQNTYNGTVAFSGTTTITHSADGSGKFSASAKGAFYYADYNSTGSGTWDLPTIPRATKPTLSAASVTMGSSVTITLTPATSTFKHKLTYTFSTASGQTSGLSIGANFTAAGTTTVTFTPPTSLANYIPTAMSGTCTIYCYTYNSSGTQIGSATSVTLTLNVPSYTPTVDSITLTGNNLLSSTYVKGKSSVNIKAKVSTSYGGYIKEFTTTVEDIGYTAGTTAKASSLEHTIVTEILKTSGAKTFTIKVTDSRGKTGTSTSSSITVYDYVAPKISSFSLARQSNETTVIATVVGTVSSVNSKNAKTIQVTLNGVTNTITSSSYTINGTTTFTNVPTDNTLTATAKITDSYTSVTADSVLPTVAVTMDFLYDGKGIAMGKVAETTDLLDVAWNERVRKNLTVNGTATVDGHTNLKYNLYVTGHLYMGGEKVQSGEKFIRFSNPDASTNPHNVCIYGGDASNAVAIGFYDSRSKKNFFTYKDASDTINIGSGASILNINGTKMADFVVEKGSTGIWDYVKWNSGDAECWGNLSITPTTGNATNSYTVDLPFSFINDSSSTFKVFITPAKTALYIGSFGDCNSSNNMTHTTTSFVMSYKYNNATPYNVSFNLSVKGKWK